MVLLQRLVARLYVQVLLMLLLCSPVKAFEKVAACRGTAAGLDGI